VCCTLAMAIDPKRIETLQKIYVRLFDENPGTREAALNSLRAWCKTEGVDPVFGLKLAPEGMGSGDTALRARLAMAETVADVQRTTIAALNAENARLKRDNSTLRSRSRDRRTQEALSEARQEIERLNKAADDADHLHQRIADLETQLADERAKHEPEIDPWHDRVTAWLADRPDAYRHATCVILQGAIGIAERNQDSEAGRRLAAIMQRIGGWSDASNIPHGLRRVRGYSRPKY
jgi:hypothetical protein